MKLVVGGVGADANEVVNTAIVVGGDAAIVVRAYAIVVAVADGADAVVEVDGAEVVQANFGGSVEGDTAGLINSTIVIFIFDEYTSKIEGASEILVSGQDIVVAVNPKVIQVSDMFDIVIKKLMMGHDQVAKFFWYCLKSHPRKL
jgi:hypothetical protein